MVLKLKPLKNTPPTDISYYDLDAEVADITLDATDRIKQRLIGAKLSIVAIGKDLATVKARLPHGLFGCWIEREFGWSMRTAQNYLSVARLASETTEEVLELLPSKVVYELASPNVPAAVKSAVFMEVEETGASPDTATVLAQIMAAKKAAATKPTVSKSSAAPKLADRKKAAKDAAEAIRDMSPNEAVLKQIVMAILDAGDAFIPALKKVSAHGTH